MKIITMNEWDAIARSFDATRKSAWQECMDFISDIRGVALDIGCGNARHLIPMARKCRVAVGIDSSMEMVRVARENVTGLHNVVLVCGDACALPFPDELFDAALFIAALHNIRGRKNRVRALCELKRVLNHDGRALISVWSKWQDAFRWQFITRWPTREHGDILIPWRKDGMNVPRFYHLYGMGEFRRDILKAGLHIETLWRTTKASKKYADNYFAVVKK